MEQLNYVYEFRMKDQTFRFEAHGDHEAEMNREFAILTFREKLGTQYDEKALEGPRQVDITPHATH